ncbi:MAG: hypothetical protein BV457_00915 [Thermoplasmata archaeon M9B1D]|nr:MAG: hypothetical protein BV457_00915 [Thermoplasmata archaeon M9B1D]PNX50694.1 MAG: hypothetical protein BV456_05830 [Thermoplasmata archaeon M8B2D]
MLIISVLPATGFITYDGPYLEITWPPDYYETSVSTIVVTGFASGELPLNEYGYTIEYPGGGIFSEFWPINPPVEYYEFEISVPLVEGEDGNLITVYAKDTQNNKGVDSVVVVYIPGDSPHTFSQTNFNLGENSIQDSSWGHVDVVYTGTEYLQYFNLVVNNNWQIRNAPLMSTQGIGVENHLGLIFDLEVSNGTDVNLINVITNVGTSMLSSPPSGSPMTVPVGDIDVTVGGRGAEPVTVSNPEPIQISVPEIVDRAYNRNMVNQDCGLNECVPAAFSNSLRWLDQINDSLNIPEDKKSIPALRNFTNWDPINGTPIDGSDWHGKRDNTSDYVTTRKFEMYQIDDVMNEIKDDQDVEIMGPHHGAVVTGILKLSDGKYIITIAHDTNQGHDGGTEEQMVVYDSHTGVVTFGSYGIDTRQRLDYFVVECPKGNSENNPPEAPEQPSGETNGRTGESYVYETETSDPDNDQVSYGWDWNGDGTVDEWTELYNSGEVITSAHIWNTKGTYSVKVKAKDEYGLEGDWSDPLSVTIPKTKVINIPMFLQKLALRFSFFEKILNQILI